MSYNGSLIVTLLAEREGYIRRGLPDRVAEVERVLESLGHPIREVASVRPAPEVATVAKPKRKRGTRGDN